MEDFYNKLEKRAYARNAILRRQKGDSERMGYQGHNVCKTGYRKWLKLKKYHQILCDHKFYIANLAVATDFSCSLNCDGCGQHTPLIKKLPASCKKVDMNQVYRDLDKISSVVDGIGGIALANGEGFLNQHVSEMITYFAKNPKVLNMNIPTNGSVIPPAEVLEKMREHQISATVTKYDAVPEEKRRKVIRLLEQYGITYTVFENRKWYSVEYLPGVQSPVRETKAKYQACERFFMLIQGKLWKCVPDATRVFAGIREEEAGDSICVKDAKAGELRKYLWQKTHQPYMEPCRHCRGTKGSLAIEIPPGRQIRK